VEHLGDGDDDDNARAWAGCPSTTSDNSDDDGVAICNTPNTIYIIMLLIFFTLSMTLVEV